MVSRPRRAGRRGRGKRFGEEWAMEEKILIVEDEEKLARFVELELVHEGYRVDKAMDLSLIHI